MKLDHMSIVLYIALYRTITGPGGAGVGNGGIGIEGCAGRIWRAIQDIKHLRYAKKIRTDRLLQTGITQRCQNLARRPAERGSLENLAGPVRPADQGGVVARAPCTPGSTDPSFGT